LCPCSNACSLPSPAAELSPEPERIAAGFETVEHELDKNTEDSTRLEDELVTEILTTSPTLEGTFVLIKTHRHATTSQPALYLSRWTGPTLCNCKKVRKAEVSFCMRNFTPQLIMYLSYINRELSNNFFYAHPESCS
jgi:hypothetical protein